MANLAHFSESVISALKNKFLLINRSSPDEATDLAWRDFESLMLPCVVYMTLRACERASLDSRIGYPNIRLSKKRNLERLFHLLADELMNEFDRRALDKSRITWMKSFEGFLLSHSESTEADRVLRLQNALTSELVSSRLFLEVG